RSGMGDLDALVIGAAALGRVGIKGDTINKVTGLQGELTELHPFAGTAMAPGLSPNHNDPGLNMRQNGVLRGQDRSHGSIHIRAANGGDGTVYLRPRGDTSTIGQVVITDSAFTYRGNAVWEAASFDPASKGNVTQNHDASEITSGILSSTRIPNLAASKITSG